MRNTQITVAAGSNGILPVDVHSVSPEKFLVASVESGAPTYNVEKTVDNVFDTSVTPVWVAVAANLTGATTTQSAADAAPARAYRLTVTGTGAVRLNVQQQGLV